LEKLPHDITNKQQLNISTSVNNSNNLLNKNNIWKYINMSPRAPHTWHCEITQAQSAYATNRQLDRLPRVQSTEVNQYAA
jgi:hypothetical protein